MHTARGGIYAREGGSPGTTWAKDDTWFLKGQAGTGQEDVAMEQVIPTEGPAFIHKSLGHDRSPSSGTDGREVPAQDRQQGSSLKVCAKARSQTASGTG